MLKVVPLSIVFLSIIIEFWPSSIQLSIPVQCSNIPHRAVLTTSGCPEAQGTRTRYSISYNKLTTSSGDSYCGYNGSGVPSSQPAVNVVSISDTKITINNDYVKKTTLN